MYNKVLTKLKTINSESMQAVGKEIQSTVTEEFTPANLQKLFGSLNLDLTKDLSLAKNLSATVVVNTSPDFGAGDSDLSYTASFAVSGLGSDGTSNFSLDKGTTGTNYIHVTVTRKSVINDTQYWDIPESDSKDSDGSGTTPTDTITDIKDDNNDN